MMKMQPRIQFSAEEFRRRLAGLEAPEARFDQPEISDMKQLAGRLVLALREVFGSALDRKTVWERIANGIPIASSKSGGKGDKFIAALLEYIKAEPNVCVGNDALILAVEEITQLSPEAQRAFIRICVEYRMLLCIDARGSVQEAKAIKDITGAESVEMLGDGTIITKGEHAQ